VKAKVRNQTTISYSILPSFWRQRK